jgi:hypothetical protein
MLNAPMQLPQLKTSMNNCIRHSTKSAFMADVSLSYLTVTFKVLILKDSYAIIKQKRSEINQATNDSK